MDMDFSYGSSHYSTPMSVLVNYFGFSSNIGMANKDAYADSIWPEMLRGELDLGRPIIYRGGGSGGNHIFICDGYNESNMFHFNMGHGGYDDGYYLLLAITGVTQSGNTFNYSSEQLAVLGITPDSTSCIIIPQKWGTSQYIVSDTINVYKQRTLLSQNGYTFTAWGNDGNRHVMVFVPDDITKQLKIELLNSNVSRVRVYDGMNFDSIMDGYGDSPNVITMHPSDYPMYSKRHALILTDTSEMYAYNYAFRITVDNGCRKVSGLGYSIVDDTVSLSWTENGNASQWYIEYGLAGFIHGEGTVVVVDTTTWSIEGLVDNQQYDFYVRPLCVDSTFDEWEHISVLVPPQILPYWKDAVTCQPEGFQIGNDGNVYIYSNEGLAWLISVCNGYNGASSLGYTVNSINLMADVDMSGYYWTPIELHKHFYGNKYVISGLTINDSSLYAGFLKSVYSSSSVRNVVFSDCNVYNHHAYGYTGCIAGTSSGEIINCGVSGRITSIANNTGGMVGRNSGNMENCYSVADVIGKQYVGGTIGSGQYSQSSIINCYSAGNVTSNNPYIYSSPYAGVFIGAANENNNTDYLAYWLQRDTSEMGCGNNVSGFSPFELNEEIDTVITITDDLGNVLGYQTIYDTVWSLVSPTTIAGQSVSTLVDALNAWVDSNNTNGEYRRWTNDVDNVNNGFPVFDVTRYQVSLLCDSSMGTVVGGSNCAEGTDVTISATANNCYHFVQWSDGNTNSTRIITASQNITLTALFVHDAPSVGSVYVTECDQYVWKDSSYSTSGVYTFDTLTSLGCDSIANLVLTINYSNLSGNESITACNSFTWNGTTYNSSGTYIYSTTTIMGCDSMATLNLVIGNVITVNDTVSSCDSYQWNGTTYNNSGTYAYSTTSVGGCDSIVILYLTINHSDTIGRDTVSSCDSYTWQDSMFYESGIYQYNSLTTTGCDSIVTLHLTINHAVNNSTTEVTCDSIVWEDETYTLGGTYLHTSVDANGCTQTDTLYLTLNHSTSSHLELVLASSAVPYDYNGVVITESGEYTIPMTNVYGCDSIIHLSVVVDNVGIESVGESDEIIVYPNPASSLISIVPQHVIDCVEIYDAIGRLVATEKGSYIINISNLPNGAYTMRIILPNTQYIKKIIKQ